MFKHKIFLLVLFIFIIMISGCNGDGESERKERIETGETKTLSAKELFDTKCGICHWQKMPENPVAPPVYNVRRRYLMQYATEEKFVNAVTSWVENPEHEKALLHGAVERFNVMPKLGYTKDEVRKIARYIYQTDFPRPAGMGQHGKGRMGQHK